jgi:hypothetical protein
MQVQYYYYQVNSFRLNTLTSVQVEGWFVYGVISGRIADRIDNNDNSDSSRSGTFIYSIGQCTKLANNVHACRGGSQKKYLHKILVGGTSTQRANASGNIHFTTPHQNDRSANRRDDSKQCGLSGILWQINHRKVALPRPHKNREISQPHLSVNTAGTRFVCGYGGAGPGICRSIKNGCGFNSAGSNYGLSIGCALACQTGLQMQKGTRLRQRCSSGCETIGHRSQINQEKGERVFLYGQKQSKGDQIQSLRGTLRCDQKGDCTHSRRVHESLSATATGDAVEHPPLTGANSKSCAEILARCGALYKEPYHQSGQDSFVSIFGSSLYHQGQSRQRPGVWAGLPTGANRRQFSDCAPINIGTPGRQIITDTYGQGTPENIRRKHTYLVGHRQGILFKSKYRCVEPVNQRTWYTMSGQCIETTTNSSSAQGPPGWDRTPYRACKKIRTRKKQSQVGSNHSGLRIPLCPGVQFASTDAEFIWKSKKVNQMKKTNESNKQEKEEEKGKGRDRD